jgi:hypothetical protein
MAELKGVKLNSSKVYRYIEWGKNEKCI